MSAQQTQEPLETTEAPLGDPPAETTPRTRFPRPSRATIVPAAVLVVVAALAGLLTRVFVKAEHTVYYWDFSGYWQPSAAVKSMFESDATYAIRTVVFSVRHNEYNLLHAVPTGIWMMVFGESRLSYELAVLVLYAFPAAAVLAWLLLLVTGRLWSDRISTTWRFVILFALVILNPFVLLPVLRGYPDVIGLIFVGLALIVYTKSRDNPTARRLLYIAGLLLVATLFRRWYIFGAASLMTAIGVDQLIYLIRARAGAKTYLVRAGMVAVMGAAFCALFAAIAWPYVSHLITTDYTDIYKAYKLDSNYVDLALRSFRHFGFVYLGFAAVGVFLALRSNRARRATIAVTCMAAFVAFLLVGRVQSFDVHQYYLLTIPILIGLASLVAHITRIGRRAVVGIVSAFAAMLIAYSVITLPVYLEVPESSNPLRIAIGPTAHGQPDVRPDVAELERLYTETLDLRSGDNSVYVLSTSGALNIDIFRNIPISLNQAMERIPGTVFTPTTILDSRDGFYTTVYDAPYVIDADPPGFITAIVSEQTSMVTLHDEMADGGILAPYYEEVDTFDLKDGVTARILHRIADVPDDVRAQILEQIREVNPNILLVP